MTIDKCRKTFHKYERYSIIHIFKQNKIRCECKKTRWDK